MHHPSDATLLGFATGALAAGLGVVVAAHLETCAACRREIGRLEGLGGALLEALPPEALEAQAFNQVLARLDGPELAARAPAPVTGEAAGLPAALRGAQLGRWFWIGRGIRYRRVMLPWAPEQQVMMFRAAPFRRVLHHTHGGDEFTLVLEGSFSDKTGLYCAGDLAEADPALEHQPTAGAAGCLCLAAQTASLRLPWLERLRRRAP